MSEATIDFTFDDAATLATTFAHVVAANLRAGIAARGHASIGLSGGTTPKLFFQELSTQSLDWKNVIVTLCDDRWVPPSSDRSNEKLLRETLLKNEAATARFQPLYVDTAEPEQGLAQVEAAIATLPMPFDVIVLGMGSDGHTASLFPDGDHLNEALRTDCTARVLPLRAPDAPESRVTLTLPALLATRALYLHIQGADKKSVFDAAMAQTDAKRFVPIRTVLDSSPVTPGIFWCP
jgi:6-phosphogluconolactonase